MPSVVRYRWRWQLLGCSCVVIALAMLFILGEFRRVAWMQSSGRFWIVLRAGGAQFGWSDNSSEIFHNASNAGWTSKPRAGSTWWWFHAGRGSGRSILPNTLYMVFVPYWPLILGSGALCVLGYRRDRAIRRIGCCPRCGYVRAGLPARARCPECGEPRTATGSGDTARQPH